MEITLASGSPQLLRVTWDPYPDPAIESGILDRLRTIPHIEGAGRRWYAPAIQMERLMVLFPKASYQYAAYCAADKAARNFYESMVHGGVEFVIEDGKVKAISDNISPLVAQLIEERALALKSFVELELDRVSRKASLESSVDGTLGQCDAKYEKIDLIARGILNAQKKAEIETQFRYGKRKGKSKPVQGSLGL